MLATVQLLRGRKMGLLVDQWENIVDSIMHTEQSDW